MASKPKRTTQRNKADDLEMPPGYDECICYKCGKHIKIGESSGWHEIEKRWRHILKCPRRLNM